MIIENENTKEIVEKIVKHAALSILATENYTIEDKGLQDIVTNLDYQMERYLKKELLTHFPTYKFIGEEENHSELTSEATWVCDPIDGTVNFTQQIPYFGVQVALLINFQPVFSLIYLPEINEMYTAVKGDGTFLNGKKIQTNENVKLSKIIVTFGDFSKSNPSSRRFQLTFMHILVEKALRVRIQGASSVDFSFLASGKNGCHIIFSKNLWEIAPGKMLAEEAGCVSIQIEGKKYGFEGFGLVVGVNKHVIDEIEYLLKSLEVE